MFLYRLTRFEKLCKANSRLFRNLDDDDDAVAIGEVRMAKPQVALCVIALFGGATN